MGKEGKEAGCASIGGSPLTQWVSRGSTDLFLLRIKMKVGTLPQKVSPSASNAGLIGTVKAAIQASKPGQLTDNAGINIKSVYPCCPPVACIWYRHS